MAHIRINDYIDIGSGGVHYATDWQIATDPQFVNILDQSMNDEVNLRLWYSMLAKPDGNGYYSSTDMIPLYARVRIYVGNTQSDWFNAEIESQEPQVVIITENGAVIRITDSDTIGMKL